MSLLNKIVELILFFTFHKTFLQHPTMRQLKGKVKETRKQRKERKLENVEIHNQMKTIVLPILGVLALIVTAFVYIKTRPSVMA